MSAGDEISDKTIWMFWDRGLEAAPGLVKLCVASWIAHNPTWRVVVLDAQSMAQYADLDAELGAARATLPIQKLAVVLRLSLLARYGGVWADCTTYCVKALDAWLPAHLEAGFFAFRNPGPDRLLANWFLAARKGDYLTTQFHRITREYFRDHCFPKQDTPGRFRIGRRLGRTLNVNTERTRHWFAWPVRRVLRIYPYFVNHYLFAELLRSDARCRAQWQAGHALLAAPEHILQNLPDKPDGLALARAEIARGHTPMYKLNWRTDMSSEYWSAVLELLRSLTPPQQ